MSKNSQKGSLNFLVLFLILAVIGVGVTSNIPIKRNYSDGKGNVQGVQNTDPKLGEGIILSDKDSQAIAQGTIGALTNYKAQVLGESIQVETPQGSKSIAVLPAQAIKNLQASGVLSEVDTTSIKGVLASLNRLIKLEEKNGVLGYQVDGFKKHKILGMLPFNTHVKAFVSAENGQVVETEQSLFGKILNKISS